MPSSIATRTGDDGRTSLLFGRRVSKDHPQIEAVGTFDELNVAIGAAKRFLRSAADRKLLESVQRALIGLMGELSCAERDSQRYLRSKLARIRSDDVALLDSAVARLEQKGRKTRGWALPGANAPAVALDQARVVARRAERLIVRLDSARRRVRPEVRKFVNRLSDVLWLLARKAER